MNIKLVKYYNEENNLYLPNELNALIASYISYDKETCIAELKNIHSFNFIRNENIEVKNLSRYMACQYKLNQFVKYYNHIPYCTEMITLVDKNERELILAINYHNEWMRKDGKKPFTNIIQTYCDIEHIKDPYNYTQQKIEYKFQPIYSMLHLQKFFLVLKIYANYDLINILKNEGNFPIKNFTNLGLLKNVLSYVDSICSTGNKYQSYLLESGEFNLISLNNISERDWRY